MGWTTAKTDNADYIIESTIMTFSQKAHEVDAFVMEGTPENPILPRKSFSDFVNRLGKVGEFAQEYEKPIFFVCDFEPGMMTQFKHSTDVLMRPILGTSLAKWAGSRLNNKKISRRNFLFGATYGFGVFLVMPFLTQIAGIPLAINGEIKKRELLRKILSHLNMYGITLYNFRDAFIAEQAETIGKLLSKQLGRKPKLQIIVSYGHSSIKEYLENPKMRRRILKHFPIKSFLIKNINERKAVEVRLKGDSYQAKEIKLKEEKKEQPIQKREEKPLTRRELLFGRRKPK
ncbi:MAG: hypothetical protein Q7S21_00280 [archaeon]|nr:hypothetical protein [archaeon]